APEKHLEPLAEKVQAAARRVAKAHKVSLEMIVTNPDAFAAYTSDTPAIAAATSGDAMKRLEEYRLAKQFLSQAWFKLDPEVRKLTPVKYDARRSFPRPFSAIGFQPVPPIYN